MYACNQVFNIAYREKASDTKHKEPQKEEKDIHRQKFVGVMHTSILPTLRGILAGSGVSPSGVA